MENNDKNRMEIKSLGKNSKAYIFYLTFDSHFLTAQSQRKSKTTAAALSIPGVMFQVRHVFHSAKQRKTIGKFPFFGKNDPSCLYIHGKPDRIPSAAERKASCISRMRGIPFVRIFEK